jgi:hypothetical protein
MLAPFVDVGAEKATDNVLSPGVIPVMVGSDGTPIFCELLELKVELVPLALIALTLK